MNKIFKLFMLAAVVLGFSSCYNEFEEPAPAKVWTIANSSLSRTLSNFSMTNMETVLPALAKRWKSQKIMSSVEK